VKYTAANITDEQIRELRDLVDSNDIMIAFNNRRMSIAYLAERALSVKGSARMLWVTFEHDDDEEELSLLITRLQLLRETMRTRSKP
jgi:hypothetical protein